MIELVLAASLLAGIVGYNKYQRDKHYSIICPRCGKICKPHTTGLRDGITHLINYKYKCSCGWRSN